MQFTKRGSLYVPDHQRQWIIPPSPRKSPSHYQDYLDRARRDHPRLATFVNSNNNVISGTSNANITVQLTSVGAGNLVVLGIMWVASDTTVTVSDGSSTWVVSTRNTSGGQYQCMAHTLASAASGTVTYTITPGAAFDYPAVFVMAWSYSGSIILEAEDHAASGTSTSPASTAISTTGTDEVVAAVCFGNEDNTNEAYASTAADHTSRISGWGSMWDRVLTGATTTQQATCTLTPSDLWHVDIQAFKITGSAMVPRRAQARQAVKRSATY